MQSSPEQYRQEIAALRARVGYLEGEVGMLRDQLKASRDECDDLGLYFPARWALTSSQRRVLAALVLSPREAATREYLFARALPPDVNPKILDVYICHIRRKLRGTGIVIRTINGDYRDSFGTGAFVLDNEFKKYILEQSHYAPRKAAA